MVNVILAALLSILAKVTTGAMMERLLSLAVVAAGRKLAKMTTNDLDDQLVDDIAKALGVEEKGRQDDRNGTD